MYQEILIATDGVTRFNRRRPGSGRLRSNSARTCMFCPLLTTDHIREVSDIIDETIIERPSNVSPTPRRNVTWSPEVAVRDGRPHREILAYADEYAVDLLVLGTHGRTEFDDGFSGASQRVYFANPAVPFSPFSATATGLPRRFDDILIATDGRHGADAAIDRGDSTGRRLRGHGSRVVRGRRHHLAASRRSRRVRTTGIEGDGRC